MTALKDERCHSIVGWKWSLEWGALLPGENRRGRGSLKANRWLLRKRIPGHLTIIPSLLPSGEAPAEAGVSTAWFLPPLLWYFCPSSGHCGYDQCPRCFCWLSLLMFYDPWGAKSLLCEECRDHSSSFLCYTWIGGVGGVQVGECKGPLRFAFIS